MLSTIGECDGGMVRCSNQCNSGVAVMGYGWLWLVGAIGVGGIELWSWGIMHNFATEVAKYRRSYTGGFYDFTRHEVDAIPDWIATLNLVGFVAAIGLLIVGFVI